VQVISTDGIRLELLGDEASQERGDEVFKERDRRVYSALREGRAVIVDATNLDRSAERLIDFAKQNASVVTVVRLDTPESRIFAQNASRDRVVPEEAVARHVQRHHTLDEAGWQKRGADLVLSVSEAEYIAETPNGGWNTRVRGAGDVQRLVQLGVATPDSAGEVRFPSGRVRVEGSQFSRQDAIFRI
jgi:predicted kinase